MRILHHATRSDAPERTERSLPSARLLTGFIAPGRESLHRCMRPHTGEWNYKSPAQIGYEVGFYDFANDALDVEHADTTFKEMENQFPVIRAQLVTNRFEGWPFYLFRLWKDRRKPAVLTTAQTCL